MLVSGREHGPEQGSGRCDLFLQLQEASEGNTALRLPGSAKLGTVSSQAMLKQGVEQGFLQVCRVQFCSGIWHWLREHSKPCIYFHESIKISFVLYRQHLCNSDT